MTNSKLIGLGVAVRVEASGDPRRVTGALVDALGGDSRSLFGDAMMLGLVQLRILLDSLEKQLYFMTGDIGKIYRLALFSLVYRFPVPVEPLGNLSLRLLTLAKKCPVHFDTVKSNN